MLTLGIINVNPVGASAITWIGVVIIALMAAVIVGLWVVVATRLRHAGDGDRDGNTDDPGFEALRHRRFIVRRSRGPNDTVVAELAPEGSKDPPADSGEVVPRSAAT